MPHKRRRPAPQRGSVSQVEGTESGVLSEALLAELGQTDACNCLIAPPRRKKKSSSNQLTTQQRDRKREQVEKKKEQDIILQDVYEKLQKHALSSEQFAALQQYSLERKTKKKKLLLEDTPLGDASSDMDSSDAGSVDASPESPARVPELHPESPVTAIDLPELHPELPAAARSPSVDSVSPVHQAIPKSVQPHRVIHVQRSSAVEASRSELPILGYEQEIMELLSQHDIVVVCGQTGCGKTTQVPQFLYEAGYGTASFPERSGVIGITQPRRIATTSTAARVAAELNTSLGDLVGFQIRHENKTSPSTAIKFMTDGILIREIQRDFLLSSYSALIIDEAHERSLNTDLILGMLSRVVKLRRQLNSEKLLKVVIMSATLEAGAFLSNRKLFPVPPPVMDIPSRQFSVTVHFSKHTEVEDYETAAFKKVCRMHRQLPPGGILVFLTGKREIDKFCAKLEKQLKKRPSKVNSSSEDSDGEDGTSEEEIETLAGNTQAEEELDAPPCSDVVVLPLYAMLPPHQQSLVFQSVPEGHRLIVVATNVAETSITIPGIRYVLDSGRAKKKLLHSETGVSHFAVDWISKASATQRAGRAGRTLPGHCYRLYSSAHYGQSFRDYELPEISCVALEEVVLLMKTMEIHKVTQFPFPTSPELSSLKAAEESLFAMGALNENRKVTEIGLKLMEFPIGPRQARLILGAKEIEEKDAVEGLALYGVSLAAAMSLESPFLMDAAKAARKQAHRKLTCLKSDPISSLAALCCYRQAADPTAFCQRGHLHGKIMKEMASLDHQLRQIFLRVFSLECPEVLSAALPEPSEQLSHHLRRCIAAGWCDQIAQKHGGIPLIQKPKHVPYTPQSRSEEAVFVHPLSAVAKAAPQFVAYTNAMKTSSRVYLHQVTRIEPEWIYEAAKPLCTVHERVLSPGPYYDAKRDAVCCWHEVTFGCHDWELPLQSIPCHDVSICIPYFALALLSGQILPQEVMKGGDQLVMAARYALSVEAKFNKRLGRLLLALEEQKIYSRGALLSHLQLHPSYLKAELKLWVKPQEWVQIERGWDSVS